MKKQTVLRVAVSLALVSGLAVCASTSGLGRATSYDPKVTRVAMPDDTYRVFEHPSDDTIMTTTSVGKALGVGAAQGATLGLARIDPPEQRHEAAARKYLDDTGRQDCPITSGYLLVQNQYEFTFQCPEGTPLTAVE